MNDLITLWHLTNRGNGAWLEAYSNFIRASENFEKSPKRKQHGTKVNYLKILLFEYAFTNFSKYLKESKCIKQNWRGPDIFGIFFCIIFDC